MATITQLQFPEFANWQDVFAYLHAEGYKDLGWLNSGVSINNPNDFIEIYHNRYRTHCISVNPKTKEFFSVDMGD